MSVVGDLRSFFNVSTIFLKDGRWLGSLHRKKKKMNTGQNSVECCDLWQCNWTNKVSSIYIKNKKSYSAQHASISEANKEDVFVGIVSLLFWNATAPTTYKTVSHEQLAGSMARFGANKTSGCFRLGVWSEFRKVCQTWAGLSPLQGCCIVTSSHKMTPKL